MLCPKCGSTSAKEVILFTSTAIECWMCDTYKLVWDQIQRAEITVRIPSEIECAPVIITLPDCKDTYCYTVHYDWTNLIS